MLNLHAYHLLQLVFLLHDGLRPAGLQVFTVNSSGMKDEKQQFLIAALFCKIPKTCLDPATKKAGARLSKCLDGTES